MELKPGAKLGPYEIVSAIGRGGMGEVWKARDPRLNRDVAIKTSRVGFSGRFQKEAQAVAALNHSNICTLFDVGPDYLVMEYIEGPTLAERIAQPIPLEEALAIAKQIADALEAAHEKGIVHRDLKPANVKIRPDGSVKVLDFGLAKTDDAQEITADSPTIMPGTQMGMILGTAGYMSPEQARGQAVDKRADVWAFGVVLYEMLTGKRLFEGATVTDSLAAILTREPDLTLAPERTRRLLRRCLEKDPRKRLRDIGDAMAWLDAEPVGAARSKSRFGGAGWIVAAVATAATLALAAIHFREAPRMVWTGSMLGTGDLVTIGPRTSPDGTTLAFIAFEGLYAQVAVMKPQTGDRALLTHNTGNGSISVVSWAPDGSRIFYDRNVSGEPEGVFSVPVLGGEEHRVLEDAALPEALADGSLLVVRVNAQRQSQIFRFWPDSGKLQALPLLAGYTVGPAVMRGLPGGHEAIAFASRIDSGSPAPAESGTHLYVVDLDSATVRRLPREPVSRSALLGSVFAPARDGSAIFAYSDDAETQNIVAVPATGHGPVRSLFSVTAPVSGVDTGPDGSLYIDQFQSTANVTRFNPDGGGSETLATFRSLNRDSFGMLRDGRPVVDLFIGGKERLMVVERGKSPVPLAATQEETALPMAALGAREAALLVGPEPRQTIAIVTVENGSIARRIRFDKGPITSLAASPDGKTIYCAAGGVVWAIPALGDTATGNSEAKKIHTGDKVAVDPAGQFLVVQLLEAPTSRLIRVPLDGGPEHEIPHPADLLPANSIHPMAVSSDGRILTPLGSATYFWRPGLTDLAGHYRQIPQNPAWDFHAMAWTPDGRIVALADDDRGTLWKFQPHPETK